MEVTGLASLFTVFVTHPIVQVDCQWSQFGARNLAVEHVPLDLEHESACSSKGSWSEVLRPTSGNKDLTLNLVRSSFGPPLSRWYLHAYALER